MKVWLPTIEPGMRAITVPITDGTGVAGLIPPRAHVNVLFTRPGNTSEAVTSTILEDIIVLAIGRRYRIAELCRHFQGCGCGGGLAACIANRHAAGYSGTGAHDRTRQEFGQDQPRIA